MAIENENEPTPTGEEEATTSPGAEASTTETTPQAEASEPTEAPVATAEAETQPERIEAADPVESPPAHVDKPALSAPDLGDLPEELTAEDFAAAVDRTVFRFKAGDIVSGTVVRVDPDEVLVDIGFKSEGVIPARELSIRNNVTPSEVVAVGDEIEALVLQMEDENGRLVLSKKRAQYERAWGRIEKIMQEGGTVKGPVIEVVKGGLIVDIGLRGFLPASLVDLRRVRDLQPYVGQVIEAKVIELDKNRNNVVLSRRAFLEEEQAEQRQAFLAELHPGDIREGVVSSVVNFGAFVDLGGMDGLVHVSELSWQHVNHPGEVVAVGDQVKVKVLEVDRERERISLSIRQTAEDPWDAFVRETSVGDVVEGVVTKTVPFGAFVSVGEGVEGLVHVSEIAMHHVESPEMELSIGQQVRVKVTEIDADRRRVSLSIKQAQPEWEARSQGWSERRPARAKRREFKREDEPESERPSFSADASLEAILEELKERGIGRS
ncbi:MAG TPA: 30S ribosomal protein S1 [Actinobacteria bacterium]|nr:30S ribosomal protein S1 [Actinomycetota bacterium]